MADEGIAELSLDDVFADEAPEREEPEPEKGVTEETEPESAEVEPEPESPSEDPESPELDHPALLAERRRRQAAEERLREYEARQTEANAPNPDDDPEGYRKYVDEQSMRGKISMSRDLALDLWSDYEDVERTFVGLVQDDKGNVTNPALLAQMQAAKNPAKFAYEHAKAHLEAEKLRDPKYIEKMRAELRAEVEAEVLAKLKADQTLKATDVPDLAGSTAVERNTQRRETELTVDQLFDE